MQEIDISRFKSELEKPQTEFFLREIRRVKDSRGKSKDIMGHTKEKFKFNLMSSSEGQIFLVGADDRISIPEASRIFMTETGSFIIKKPDGMVFLNSR